MPSPIGHAIAGLAIAGAITPRQPPVAVACAALAMAADLDLVIPNAHRMATHGVGAVAAVTILTIGVTGQVTSSAARGRVVAACVLAYASHLLLDWLGADPVAPRGLQLLWPFSDRWFISDWDVFRGTTRRQMLTSAALWTNATAIAQEIAILGPIAWFTWRRRGR